MLPCLYPINKVSVSACRGLKRTVNEHHGQRRVQWCLCSHGESVRRRLRTSAELELRKKPIKQAQTYVWGAGHFLRSRSINQVIVNLWYISTQLSKKHK
jgi:hypothetical protein